MKYLTLTLTEFRKLRHSRILLLLLLPLVILWLPNVVNADMSLTPVMEGITPEHNFLIQSFMGFAWFIYPACMIVCTVLLQQLERGHKGILKMLALPLSPSALALCKWIVLLALAFFQCALMNGLYFICAYGCFPVLKCLSDGRYIHRPYAGRRYFSIVPAYAGCLLDAQRLPADSGIFYCRRACLHGTDCIDDQRKDMVPVPALLSFLYRNPEIRRILQRFPCGMGPFPLDPRRCHHHCHLPHYILSSFRAGRKEIIL